MSAAATQRLQAERKNWRKEHPRGFVAKPNTNADGSSNLFEWTAKVPARATSIWAPGLFTVSMSFPDDYPARPPTVKFAKIDGQPLFHPNVYPDGGVCLSIINPEGSTHAYGKGGTWKPTINIPQILLALQTFLDEPQGLAAGREEPYRLYKDQRSAYEKRVKQQVKQVETAIDN
jgi:ubiquitin-conjugating enzyme E2 I